jgi:hypothetical protein
MSFGINWYKPNICRKITSSSRKQGGVPNFGKGFHKVKHLFKWGATYKANKGDKIHFWQDIWVGNSPLKIQFPDLYKICDDQEAFVADCYDSEEGWEIGFRRALNCRDVEQWQDLLDILKDVNLNALTEDELEWALDKSKNFTIK